MTARWTVLASLLSMSVLAQDAGVALIPRDVLFGNPERTRPLLSPDGKSLAWLAPDEKNVLQIWVQPVGSKDAPVVVTADKKRGIRGYLWLADSKSIAYGQDADGDENFHVYQVNLATKTVRDLSPWQGVRAAVLATSSKQPNTLLITANVRDNRYMDVYRVDLTTGGAVLDTQNPGDIGSWLVDAAFQVRGAEASTKEGGSEIRVRETVKSPWKALITVGLEENIEFVDFSEDGKSIFLNTSVNSDTTRLVEKNIKTGTERELFTNPKSDVGEVLGYPVKHGVRAVASEVDGRQVWSPVEPSMKGELEAMDAAFEGQFSVTSMDDADTRWLVAEERDVGPIRYYSWDRKAKKAEFLLTAQPKLEGLALAPMKPVLIAARDGLQLPSLLTLPNGKSKNLPTVLLVHGGPWAKDSWGYRAAPQWLANRGYAVLQVNYRASTGYGKKFLNAGNRQWGLAMHDDLIDGVKWLVSQGIADPKKVAIMGGSYGGYATLAGVSFTPDTFACGVDIVGPANLFTLLDTIPAYWASGRAQMYRRMGDPTNPADKELLTKASPVFAASKIKVPLLIGQGANDPRVKQAESEQIVSTMEKNGLPVTYALYPDEGHGFARPENRIDFYARAEGFLSKCLGGRVEPLPKEGKIAGSTAVVKVVAAAPKK